MTKKRKSNERAIKRERETETERGSGKKRKERGSEGGNQEESKEKWEHQSKAIMP